MEDMESHKVIAENDVCNNLCDKTLDKIGYKYPLCCLAVWILGIAVFAIIISENAK